jgi:hypothetical protein
LTKKTKQGLQILTTLTVRAITREFRPPLFQSAPFARARTVRIVRKAMQRRMSHKEVSAADTHRSPKDGRGWGWGVQCVDPTSAPAGSSWVSRMTNSVSVT